MKYKLLIILSSIILSACHEASDGPSGTSLVTEDDVLLVLVDGEPISLPMLEFVMGAQGIDEENEEGMRSALDELIRMQAVANAAEESGLLDEPRSRALRRLRDLEAIRASYLERFIADNPVTSQEIRQLYEAQAERSGGLQYQIETVIYTNQPGVLRDLARLDSGEISYEGLLAEARSNGLVVDQPLWVDLSQLPPDIAALLAEAEPGEVLSMPLQTPQGWRLVQLVATREFQPPPLEEVRDGIEQTLRRQRVNAHIEALYEAAEITPMLPLDGDASEPSPDS
jgi:peptidyl-prolyl cis-trans isomerase C